MNPNHKSSQSQLRTTQPADPGAAEQAPAPTGPSRPSTARGGDRTRLLWPKRLRGCDGVRAVSAAGHLLLSLLPMPIPTPCPSP